MFANGPAFLTILMWGLWGYFGKVALQRGVSPLSVFVIESLLGCGIAAVVLLVTAISAGKRPAIAWNWPAALSALGLTLGLLCYYVALQRQSASVVVTLTALYPIITIALSFAILGERPTPRQCVGLVLAITSVPFLMG